MTRTEKKIADELIAEAAGTEMKYCSRCKTLKPTSEFYKNKAMKDGLQSMCKKCRHEIDRERGSHGKKAAASIEETVTVQPVTIMPETKSEESKETIKTMDGRILVKKENQNKPLEKYTPRELLSELKRRGYKWDRMYVEQTIDWNKI